MYGCLLDCTKAFDTVEHSRLFDKLLEVKVPKIIIRMLTFIYRKQTANVRLKQQVSEQFGIKNGVRQGAVISPIFFNFYMNSLFAILKKNKSGCFISNYYAGCEGMLMISCFSVPLGVASRRCWTWPRSMYMSIKSLSALIQNQVKARLKE